MKKTLFSLIVLIAILMVAGCTANESVPTATSTIAPKPASTATVEPEPTESQVSNDPRNATDNLLVNATINLLLDRDIEALTEKFQLLDVPCTTADGLGGPPKCPPGFAQGTVMTVFPVSCGEGQYLGPEPERVATAIIDYPEPQLFSVVLLEPRETPEWYFPMGTYSVILEFDARELGRVFRLDDQGKIVRVNYCFISLEQEVTTTQGTILFRK